MTKCFILLAIITLALAPFAAGAQQPAKVWRGGFVMLTKSDNANGLTVPRELILRAGCVIE